MRRIPPATKVRHARAQHAAQSAKQPHDLCFLPQASSNKLRIPACSLVCRFCLGRARLQPSAQGLNNRLGAQSYGAAAASSTRSQHATSSPTAAGMAVNIIRVPRNPRPAACHLSGHAPTPPAPRPARSLRAQSFLALPAGASGAQVATWHTATACLEQSHRRSSTIPRTMPCWSGRRRYWWAVRAQSKLDAQRSKVSTLVPNSPRSASQRVIRRFTGLHGGIQHPASSIGILLVRRFGVGSRAHTR
jgi:hypothetical protein